MNKINETNKISENEIELEEMENIKIINDQEIIQKIQELEKIPQEFKKIHLSDGSIYEGYVRNDIKDGKGKLTDHDGGIYVGQFKNDQKEG